MAHQAQRQFVQRVRRMFPAFFRNCSVLEIGSLDINGSVRDFYEGCLYLGVDLGEGPGVDVVAYGERLPLPDNSFDAVISLECFEHNPEWRATFSNMHRISSGLVLVTAATTGRPEHGTRATTPEDSPFTVNLSDYYANVSLQDLLQFPLKEMFSVWNIEVNDESHDIYFWGIKKSSPQASRNRGIVRGGTTLRRRVLSRVLSVQTWPALERYRLMLRHAR